MASDSRVPAPEGEAVRPPAGHSAPDGDGDGVAERETVEADEAVAQGEQGGVAGEKESGAGWGTALLSKLSHNRFVLFNAVPSWMVSMLVHAVLIMILAVVTMPQRRPEQRIVAVSNPSELEEIEKLDQEEIDPLNVEVFEGQAPAELTDVRTTTDDLDVPSLDDVSAAPEEITLEDFGEMSDLSEALMDRVGGGTGSGLGKIRSASGRRAMVKKYGGSEGSEAAVAAALKWLAMHQMQDGGWSFDHTKGACRGRCSHPGKIKPARNGATAMALLPFLGAGQTHQQGKYQETVERGLSYLIRAMKPGNDMGSLWDGGGRMYSHGMAAITLCEAYAMTNDQRLLQPAQMSLNFIVYAQDPVGGGWRYEPNPPEGGDTSILGWQLMALKSGHMAYLQVPKKTIVGASRFLDSVQADNGAKYGYTAPGDGSGTTAVGLLCRMYLGWNQQKRALEAGVKYLHNRGPTKDMYYNYYATQVMRHYGGQYWEDWNSEMRDWLVDRQDKKGHATGSWFIPGGRHNDKGGRLYCTSMATMILEVYYRHMPIYGKQAAEEEFPL
ncbi:MAG: prenyltransferase/squalene oxidase repeat-containing protein [Planctomycetota bacterium]